jgi:sigma-B regulation protein RsbU (phosphoserine phosphatase)
MYVSNCITEKKMIKEDKKVLIIDDDHFALKLIKHILENAEFDVFTAETPEEGYGILKDEVIDLVLLDLILKNDKISDDSEPLSGYDVIRELKRSDATREIPIIFLTSVSNIESKVKAFQAGASDYVTKPYSSSELIARINTHINLKRIKEENEQYTTRLEEIVKEKTKQIEDYAKNLEAMVEEKVGIIKIQNEAMKRDLESARRMQIGLLPKKFPTLRNLNIDVMYHPCDKIGGDFYDIFNLDEAHVGFYIADVSGHGVSASMVTFFVKELIDSIKKIIFQNGNYEFSSPETIMEKVNLKILEEDFSGLYVTLFYAILNIKTGEMAYSNAGHIAYPVIYRSSEKEVSILKTKSMALGWFDYADYERETVVLNAGDKLFLYTDGITDSKNLNGDIYGVDKFSAVVKEHGYKKLSVLSFRILKELRMFQRKKELEDDITLLGMEYLVPK